MKTKKSFCQFVQHQNNPLMMRNDMRSRSQQAYTIYADPAILAINQKPLTTPAIQHLENVCL